MRYRKKGLPDKEFNANTKGEVKKMSNESVLAVETKEIRIIPQKHQKLIKEVAMEYSPNKNERFLCHLIF